MKIAQRVVLLLAAFLSTLALAAPGTAEAKTDPKPVPTISASKVGAAAVLRPVYTVQRLGRCLDSNGRTLYTNGCGNHANRYQWWILQKSHDGFYYFRHFASWWQRKNICLDGRVPNAYVLSCNGGRHQRWAAPRFGIYHPVDNGTLDIHGRNQVYLPRYNPRHLKLWGFKHVAWVRE